MAKMSVGRALVTGAGSGIGRALALALAARGGRVALWGRTEKTLRAVAAAAGGDGVFIYPVDLCDEEWVRRAAHAVQAQLGGVDLLIHSAGEICLGSFATGALADFDRQYRINVRAPYLLTQLLLPALKECSGQVVFINSSAGLTAGAGGAQYAATKHGLKALADSLREEVNPEGVRVLSVYPGRTATPMQEGVCRAEGRSYRPQALLQPEDVASAVLQAVTLPRTAELTDLSIRPMRNG